MGRVADQHQEGPLFLWLCVELGHRDWKSCPGRTLKGKACAMSIQEGHTETRDKA